MRQISLFYYLYPRNDPVKDLQIRIPIYRKRYEKIRETLLALANKNCPVKDICRKELEFFDFFWSSLKVEALSRLTPAQMQSLKKFLQYYFGLVPGLDL